MNGPQTIDEYLDELLLELRGRDPAVIRRVLAESEDHLRQSITSIQTTGVERTAAERLAISAFGSTRATAAAFPKARRPIDAVSLSRQALLLLGAVLLTIGLSGAVLIAFDQAAGVRFAGREDYGFESVGRQCWPPPENRLVCSRDQIHRLEDEARRDQLYSDIRLRGGFGLAGAAALIAGGLVRPGVRRGRVIAGPRAAAITTCVVAGVTAVVFVLAGWNLSTTAGRTGGGWLLSFGVASACTFVASLVWLTTESPRMRLPLLERRRAL